MFHEHYPVDALKPAPYNPRRIGPTAFEDLKRSITVVGMAKPIIVNSRNDTIVAGHQRLKALISLGWKTAPVFLLTDVTTEDEMRFNQLHNGTDLDTGDEHVMVPASDGTGYVDVPFDQVQGNFRAAGAPLRSEICKLVGKYGPWGGIVASQTGECVSGAQYALACAQMGYPVRTFYIKEEHKPIVKAMFQKAYGEFHYDQIQRETYIQTFAQPFRLRMDKAGNVEGGLPAPTWEWRVLPEYQPGETILDFGCGQGDYVKKLSHEGYPIWGIEFFYRAGNKLNTKAVHAMIDAHNARISTVGRYDIVVADYVLNSVDTVTAEEDVLRCLFAFAKQGAKVYFSGRRREAIENNVYSTKHTTAVRGVEFLDSNGLSAIQRKGHWFFQKYHTKAEAIALARKFFTTNDANIRYSQNETQFQIKVIKDGTVIPSAEDIEASIRREFNLPWPSGKTVGKPDEAVAAWQAALNLEGVSW